MAEDIRLKIGAKLTEESKQTIVDQINGIQAELNNKPLEIKIDAKVLNVLDRFSTAMEKLNDKTRLVNRSLKEQVSILKDEQGRWAKRTRSFNTDGSFKENWQPLVTQRQRINVLARTQEDVERRTLSIQRQQLDIYRATKVAGSDLLKTNKELLKTEERINQKTGYRINRRVEREKDTGKTYTYTYGTHKDGLTELLETKTTNNFEKYNNELKKLKKLEVERQSMVRNFKENTLKNIDYNIGSYKKTASPEALGALKELRKSIQDIDVADKNIDSKKVKSFGKDVEIAMKKVAKTTNLSTNEIKAFNKQTDIMLNQFKEENLIDYQINQKRGLLNVKARAKDGIGIDEKTYQFDRSAPGKRLELIKSKYKAEKQQNIKENKQIQAERDKYVQWWEKNLREQELRDRDLQERMMRKEEKRLARLGRNVRGTVDDDSLFKEANSRKMQTHLQKLFGDKEEVKNLQYTYDSAGKEIVKFDRIISNNDGTFQQYKSTVDQATKTIRDNGAVTRNEINRNLTLWKQFKIAMQRIPIWFAGMTVYMQVINAIRNGVQAITDIDTALTNLRKVTDGTKETFKDFANEANDIGRSLGKSTAEVIDATAEFARLGYSLNESKLLAEQSILYSNVGDIDVTQASQSIISAVKGFNIEVDSTGKNVERIVDMYNEVGNNFAISSEGIGEAMRRSSASLYSAGNTIEQAIGMITAANAVIQDPAQVGTAMKTISMR